MYKNLLTISTCKITDLALKALEASKEERNLFKSYSLGALKAMKKAYK